MIPSFCKAKSWVAEMESEIPTYFPRTPRRTIIKQKHCRNLCALCLPKNSHVMCVLSLVQKTDCACITQPSPFFPASVYLCLSHVLGQRNESSSLSCSHQLFSLPLHRVVVSPVRKGLSLLSTCMQPCLYTLTRVLEEESGLLSLPASFAKAIESSRQFLLTLSL